MKILLVGDANSIFLIDYTIWLKKSMDVEVDIYSIYQSNGDYNNLPYNRVFESNYNDTILSKIKGVRTLIYPFFLNIEFNLFLKKHNEKYDIIHFHWIIPAWVLTPNAYKRYSRRVFATFWGGERDVQEILFSKQLYKTRAASFLKKTDCIVGNNKLRESGTVKTFPFIKEKYKFGIFGSTPLEILYSLQESETCEESKVRMGIKPDKISVLLGYSGKRIHNHLEIINSLIQNSKYQHLKEKIQLVASMSRGADENYISEIENKLSESGFEYVLFKKTYFTEEEVARLRNASDVVFQLSTFDGLSRTILECLCAGSIVISGDWLNYLYFKDEGFKFVEVSNTNEAIDYLYKISLNPDVFKLEYKANILNGKNRYTWKECIKDWVKHYRELQ